MSELPKGWTIVPLFDTLQCLESGGRPKGGVKGIAKGIPSIGGEHLTYNGRFDFSSIRYVPKEFVKRMTKGQIKRNDILIVKDGATTGKTAFAGNDFPFDEAVVNEHVFICRLFKEIEPRFIFRFLTSKEGQKQILDNFQGSAQGGINLSFAPNTNIPLAPFNEQRRIVEKLEKLLHKVNACKERLEKIPAILKRFRQSVLAAACSGRLTADWREKNPDIEPAKKLLKRSVILSEAKNLKTLKDETLRSAQGDNFLSEFPETWVCTYIEQILSCKRKGLKTGPFGTMLKKEEHQSQGIPVLGIENIGFMCFKEGSKIHITHKKAEELSEYEALPGDILISRSGTVGEVCVVPSGLGGTRISTNIIRVVLKDEIMIPIFFCYLFNGFPFVLDQVRELCKGSTRNFLNQTILKEILFPLPPLPEQQEIVRRVEALFKKADEIEERYKKAKAFLDRLTQSILAKAFRGELVPQDPNDEPASVLLERIREAKKKAMVTGKQKRDKRVIRSA